MCDSLRAALPIGRVAMYPVCSTVFSPEPLFVQLKNEISDKMGLFKLWASVETEVEIIQKLKHEFRGGFLKIPAIYFTV